MSRFRVELKPGPVTESQSVRLTTEGCWDTSRATCWRVVTFYSHTSSCFSCIPGWRIIRKDCVPWWHPWTHIPWWHPCKSQPAFTKVSRRSSDKRAKLRSLSSGWVVWKTNPTHKTRWTYVTVCVSEECPSHLLSGPLVFFVIINVKLWRKNKKNVFLVTREDKVSEVHEEIQLSSRRGSTFSAAAS